MWRSFFTSGESSRETFDRIIANLAANGILEWEGPASPSFARRDRLVPDFRGYDSSPGRLARPVAVGVTLTNRCDVSCRYCYAGKEPSPEMDLHQLRTVFDELAENEIFGVDIYGGDLFARPDILSILTQMVERDFVFSCSTKYRLSEPMAARLAELGVGRKGVPPHRLRPLQISIDSADPDMASRLAGRSGYLERTIESVKNVTAFGLAPRIKAVLTALNADAAEDLVALFTDLGVTEFQFVQYGRSFYRPDESLFLSLDRKLALRSAAERLRMRYPGHSIAIQQELSMGGARTGSWERWRKRSICSGGRLTMLIKANGDVTLCEQVPHGPPFVVGNVLRQGVLGVWNSAELAAFLHPPRELFHGSICFDCEVFPACHDERLGYCYRDTLFSYGAIYDAPPDCPRQTAVGLRQV